MEIGVLDGEHRLGGGKQHRRLFNDLVEVRCFVIAVRRHALREAGALLDVNAVDPTSLELSLTRLGQPHLEHHRAVRFTTVIVHHPTVVDL